MSCYWERKIQHLLKLNMRLTKLPMDNKNRKLRFGFGLNGGQWFIRIDLWFYGFRLNKN